MCAANADDMNDPAARTAPFTRCLRCPTTYHTGITLIFYNVMIFSDLRSVADVILQKLVLGK